MMSATLLSRTDWKTRFAVLGAVTSVCIAARVLRVFVLWAQLCLGPVRVKRFKGEWALVTGGSEGVGKAVAAQLASHGVNVMLVSRSQKKLDAAAQGILEEHPTVQVRTYATDLTEANSCRQLLQHLTISNTPISILIANVGGGIRGPTPYWEFTEDEETYLRNLNGQACYSLVRGLLPDMIRRGRGVIVAVSSAMHKFGAYAVPYASEKAKMNALMTALDVELQGTGVTAQAMVLGPVTTPGVASLLSAHRASKRATSNSNTSSNLTDTSAEQAARQASSGIKADDVAAAMVRAVGTGGPVITPYFGHLVMETVFHDMWWPPELQREMRRFVSGQFKTVWDGLS